MITVENEYYIRIILLLCDACSFIAKKIIERELPKYGVGLDALLKSYEGKLRHEFHKKQMQKLFPNDGYDKTNVEAWDLQMLVGVLLLIFRDGLSDTEKENIKDIKNFRNTILAHSQSAALKKEEYEAIQRQLQNAIESLASLFDQSVIIRCNEYISTCKSGSLDINFAVKCVQQLGDCDDKFKKILDEIRSSQETSKDCQGKLDSLLERVERINEQTLKGFREILQELKVLKSKEVEKQSSSSDGQTVETDRAKVVVGKLKQKISAYNQSVDADVRTSIQPFDRTSYCQEISEEEDNTLLEEGVELPPSDAFQKAHLDGSTDAGVLSIECTLPVEEQHDANTYLSSSSSDNFAESQVSTGEKTSVKHIRIDRINLYRSYDRGSEKLIVAAIDIGTSFSGIAFSVNGDIYVPVLDHNCRNTKTPTVVLFDNKKVFHSFGSDAEDRYANSYEDDEHLDWFLFQNFKMKLYKEKVIPRETIDDVNGRTMYAVDVMSAVIRYLSSEVINHLRKQVPDDSDILWVLTVPATWTDSSKVLVREAAESAGIKSGNLKIALEAEAASLYCQHGTTDDGDLPMKLGTKYLVIDMGGRTVDIAVCEVENTGTRVLHTDSYTDCGGRMVDARFLEFIASITGDEVFLNFCKENKIDLLDLRRDFECKKHVLDTASENVYIRMPSGLLETCNNDSGGKNFKEKLKESKYKETVSLRRGKLVIDNRVLKNLFTCCCQNIVRHIKDLLATSAAEGIQLVLLTGGFSNSEIIQNAVADAFPNLRVLVPENADLAVLKGAILYGIGTSQISTRLITRTYGFEITPIFDPTVHSESRRVSINGQDRCKHVFQKVVGRGECVSSEEVYCHEQTTLIPFQQKVTLNIYGSEKDNPRYVDDESCQNFGSLIIKLPCREKSFFNVKFQFGGNELVVTSVDLTNGTSIVGRFEFSG